MEKRVRLIWDFFGPDAQNTAKHHEIHLKDFMVKENMPFFETAVTQSGSNYQAELVVEERDVLTVRDALKPHRAYYD